MKTLATYKKGISILGIVVFGFVVILVLSYYNISIRGVVESPTGQDNINYVAGTSQSFWNKYLATPASYLWNDIWVDIFWKGFVNNMEKIRDGTPTDFDNAVPSVNINN